MRLLSIGVTSAAAGVLLALLGFMYVCHKLRVSPWFFSKFWLFFTISIVVVGISIEVWIARRPQDEEETTDDRRDTDPA